MHLFKHHQTATGEIWKSVAIKLTRADPISIDKYDRKDSNVNYAYRFLTYEDLDSKWSDDNIQFIRFRVFARHATSGFGSFLKRDYRLKRKTIIEGTFSKGNTFDVA